MPNGIENISIAWHPAFYSAAEFDFRLEKENFEFETEYNLSREPIRMDLLIIKRNSEIHSDNDIAGIFKKYNVVEYKSPDDALTIDDFYKTIAYACLYKAISDKANYVSADELTISFFRERYPRKLIKMLRGKGLTVCKSAPGIHQVIGLNLFPIQIVVTKELNSEKHAGLKILSKHAQIEDIEMFLQQARKSTDLSEREMIDAILQVSVSANRNTYEGMKRRDSTVCEALKLLMKDEIDEEIMEKDKKNAINLYKNGVCEDIIAESLGVAVETVTQWLLSAQSL